MSAMDMQETCCFQKNWVWKLPQRIWMIWLQKANQAKVAQEQLDAAKAFAEVLSSKEILLSIKVGEGGKTFGSISSKEISEAAKKQFDLDIDKKKIQLPNPIRALGTTEVVKLHPKVTASLKVTVKEA